MSALPLLFFAGLLAMLLMGIIFSLMESMVLMLNRARLVTLFADEADADITEQAIFRETKEVYFVSRLGFSASLVGSGFCMLALVAALLHSAAFLQEWPETLRFGLYSAITLVLLPPIFLFGFFAVPRILTRQEVFEKEDDLPRWAWPVLQLMRRMTVLAQIFYLLPLERLFQHHELTKGDLLAMVTELDIEEEDTEDETTEEDEEETDEGEILYNILDLEETLVREVMKPINSVVALRLGTATTEDVLLMARRTGHSRFPVYYDRIVDLVGYVNVYDILRNNTTSKSLEEYVTRAMLAPEFMRVNVLLKEFQENNIQVAIVVDEYGGCSGWVTREDVLEEIVGEIEDEFDRRSHLIRQEDATTWYVEGSVDTDDLMEVLPLEIEENQYDTLAGYILMTLGRMPERGDRVETEDAVFTVERLERNRIALVKVELNQAEEDTGDEEAAYSNGNVK